MPCTVQVQLSAPDPKLIHEFRNFGEDVYRRLREECEVSIAEVDASASEFCLRGIRKREVRATIAKVQKLAASYPKLSPVEICEVPEA
ncbi:MAG: hypothetical protein QM796_16570 [Chthoniobacteraceae bacterium]